MSDVFCSTAKISHESYTSVDKNISGLHIYKIKLSSYYDLVPRLKSYLDPTELKRAQKYHFDKDKNQFIICRSLLKFILVKYTGLSIYNINIKIDKNKKPYVFLKKSIYFNLSHSKDFALIAISTHNIGVDIEFLNENFDFYDMMPTIFNFSEIEAVSSSKHKAHTFFKFWTRKESIVKATGQGISNHLLKIPALNGKFTVDSNILNGIKSFLVFSFDLNTDYIAAITIISENIELNNFKIYNLPNTIEGLLSFSNLKP